VIANLGMKGGSVRFGDVGRVADDGVEGARCCSEEVGAEESDLVGNLVRLGVSPGDFDGIGGDVHRGDFGVGELEGQGDG